MTHSLRGIYALGFIGFLSVAAMAQSTPTYLTTPFPAGIAPYSVAIGDLNGDGTPDLVTASETANTISVLLGTGTGSFGAPTSFAVGSHPYAVAIGDVNGDRTLDVVTANFLSDNVSVLLGTGTGSFAAQTTYVAGNGPSSIAIGDLDGNGTLDLVTANGATNDVSILLGMGSGTFGAPTAYGVNAGPSAMVAGVAIADLNGDGRLDVLAAGGYLSFGPSVPGFVSTLLGTGVGTFAPATATLGVDNAGGPRALAIADLNNDGVKDAVTANSLGTVSVLFGTGTGSFLAPQELGVGYGPSSVAIGDLNADGILDLVTANFGLYPSPGSTISVLLGISPGTFASPLTLNVGSEPRTVAIGDLNRDGGLDLVTANLSSADVTVLVNTVPSIHGVNAYGTGTWGCAGQLGLNVNSVPQIGNGNFAITGSNAPHSALGFLLLSDVQDLAGSDSFGVNVLLHLAITGSPVFTGVNAYSGPSGEQFAPIGVPNNPALAGLNLYAQTFFVEPMAGHCTPGAVGFVSSRGLKFTIQP